MTTIPSRELKSRLGKYLKLVKAGEPVRITDREQPIACLMPLAPREAAASRITKRLAEKGSVTFGTGAPIAAKPPAPLRAGKSIAQMVAEDRR